MHPFGHQRGDVVAVEKDDRPFTGQPFAQMLQDRDARRGAHGQPHLVEQHLQRL